MKRIIALLIAIAALVCFAACSTGGDNTATPDPKTTENNAADVTPEKATEAGTTQAPTAAPATDVPATKEPAPGSDIDAILIDFEDDTSYTCYGSMAEINPGEPWLTIITNPGDNNFVAHFDEGFGFDSTEYPYIAFKYRVGYGQSVRASNHLYAMTASGGPTPNNGWWYHLDYINDLDWHVAIVQIASAFPSADNEWRSLRTPTVDTAGGDLAYAWLGVFKSVEDIEKYDAAYNEKYGELLVKAAPPDVEKQESVPLLDDAFENVNINFEDCEQNATLTSVDMFNYVPGLNNSVYVDRDGGTAAQIEFDALYYNGLVKSGTAYTVSFDLMNVGGASMFGGFIFNYGDEGNTSRNFYEDSGLVQAGGYILAGASGCGVTFKGEKTVMFYIPVWDADNTKLTVATVDFEGPVDFNAAYSTFRLEDDGQSKVTIYVNDELFVTVEYSDPGMSAAPTLYEQYYRSVKISAAYGTELLKVDNAHFSIYKSFAFGDRAHKICVDNITIANK